MSTTFGYARHGSQQHQMLGNLMGISSVESAMTSGHRLVGDLAANITKENMPPLNPGQSSRPPGNLSAMRTPLSLLNEICTKSNTNPTFEILSEGPVHKPSFECVVRVERDSFCWEARGKGHNKKDAKQEAARALLQTMDERTEKFLIPASKPARPETPDLDVDADVVGNPIGDLNDLCMRVRISPPKYESVGEEGKPHARVYYVECSLTSKIKETGRGRNKKHAKRVAASAVLKILHDTGKLNGDVSTIFTPDEAEQLSDRMGALQLNFAKYFKDIAANEPEVPKRAVDLAHTIMSLTGPKIEALGKMTQKELTKCDFVPLLKEISDEQNFTVDLYDMSVQSDDSRHRCFAYCNMNPIIIRLGTGSSPAQAQKSAAFEILEFLRNVMHK